MFRSFLLTIFLFSSIHPSSCSIECYVGSQNDTIVEDGFDFCVSTVNVVTEEIRYDGRAGPTTVFLQTNPKNLALNNCFIQDDSRLTSCFCKGNRCNRPMTLSGFRRMMFESRDS